jgi:hypothetical protein
MGDRSSQWSDLFGSEGRIGAGGTSETYYCGCQGRRARLRPVTRRRSTGLGSIKSAKLIAPVRPRLRKKIPLGTDREMPPRPPSRVRWWRRDCVAGHARLELRNVGNNYPFERSHRFPGIKPNSGHRDYSRLNCGGGENAARACGDFRGRSVIGRSRLARIPEMIRRRPIEQHHCALCAGLFPPSERVWWHGQQA